MTPHSVTEKYKRLSNTNLDEARDFLLSRAFAATPCVTARKLFFDDFANIDIPAEAKEALSRLSDTESYSVKIRRESARYIDRKARGNWTTMTKRWLADPRTIDDLLPAVDDPDTEVKIAIVRALGNLSQRYEYLDYRILKCLSAAFPFAKDSLRLEIIAAIPQFGGKAVWDMVLQAFACKSSNAKATKICKSIGRYARKTLRSKAQRDECYQSIITELSTCSSLEGIDNWCSAILRLALPETETHLYEILPKKFHKIVETNARNIEVLAPYR